MKSRLFWLRRFAAVFMAAFLFIAAVQMLRGRAADLAVVHGLIWAAISASIFVGTQIYKSRKQEACAICEAVGNSPPTEGPAYSARTDV